MFRRLAPIKKDMLAVSREFYPLGCAGWERGVETLADRCYHDEEHRLLTTVPPVTLKKAAARMLQNLTSKGQPWYYLSVPKVLKGSVSNGVRGVLDKHIEASRYVFSRSNAYSSIYRLFVHYLAYGKAFKLDEATLARAFSSIRSSPSECRPSSRSTASSPKRQTRWPTSSPRCRRTSRPIRRRSATVN